MTVKENKPNLRLITPEDIAFYQGPITRLDLWYRFPKVSLWKLCFSIGTKLLLLATIIYFARNF